MKKLLIDAISISSGGAINHLKNILINFHTQNFFSEIDVYLPEKTKEMMPKIKNINYKSPKILNKFLFMRVLWQIFILNFIVLKNKYSCIFVTGSSHMILSKPVVTISQNLLPFSPNEIKKYFFSLFYIKLKILYITQTLSIKFSEGVIFLHKHSRNLILKKIGGIKGLSRVIGHGINVFKKNSKYKKSNYRLIYVSNIDYYKNQIFLIRSLDNFIKKYPNLKNKLKVEFYGSSYQPALKKFNNFINHHVTNRNNFKYFGHKNAKFIYKERKLSDTIFLFASSCENFAVSLIEGMSRGYPILCVNLQPMRSVLGNSAFFYNLDSEKSFQNRLIKILSSKRIQNELSNKVFSRSKIYSDQTAANKTFNFLIKISKKYEK